MATTTQVPPPWYIQCLENIKKLGGVPCDESKCIEVSRFTHQVCNCLPPYVNGCQGQPPSPGCCAYTASSPVAVFQPTDLCYCCCGMFGAGVPTIATGEDSHKSVQDLSVGDTVYVARDAALSGWTSKPLAFSAGMGSSATDDGTPVLRITFDGSEGGERTLWVSPQQVFLVKGGKLKRASRLVPGQDALLDKNGQPVSITEIAQGQTNKGTYNIATSLTPAHSADGHLVLMEGIVAGDFALQLSTDPALFVEGHEALPLIGSTAYTDKYGQLSSVLQLPNS